MTEPWHGTQSGYTYHACRCDRCRRAAADAQRRLREKKRATKAGPQPIGTNPDVPHGTVTGYTSGCRCDACTAANSTYVREYRAARRARTRAGEPVGTHGTTGYELGCRCEVCLEAYREYQSEYRHWRKT